MTMAKIGIYYGSTTGTCEDIANRIAKKIEGSEIVNASELSADNVAKYDVLLLGTSTWGAGELQDDWFDACDKLKAMDLSGKTVALFCVGDCEMYSDTFCGALAPLYDSVKNTGAKIVGAVSDGDYNYAASEGVVNGSFLGLALDESNEAEKTDARIDKWIASLGL